MCCCRTLLFCFLIVILLKDISLQAPNPCPQVFQYSYDGFRTIGLIRITNIDTTTLRLNVKLSLAAPLPSRYPGEIRTESKERLYHDLKNKGYLEYQVIFPIDNPLPLVTSISMNGFEICSGPPARGSYRTVLSLDHTLFLSSNFLTGRTPSNTFNNLPSDERRETDIFQSLFPSQNRYNLEQTVSKRPEVQRYETIKITSLGSGSLNQFGVLEEYDPNVIELEQRKQNVPNLIISPGKNSGNLNTFSWSTTGGQLNLNPTDAAYRPNTQIQQAVVQNQQPLIQRQPTQQQKPVIQSFIQQQPQQQSFIQQQPQLQSFIQQQPQQQSFIQQPQQQSFIQPQQQTFIQQQPQQQSVIQQPQQQQSFIQPQQQSFIQQQPQQQTFVQQPQQQVFIQQPQQQPVKQHQTLVQQQPQQQPVIQQPTEQTKPTTHEPTAEGTKLDEEEEENLDEVEEKHQVVDEPQESLSDICGIPVAASPLILQGVRTPRGSYPWHTALFTRTDTGIDFTCGGNLLSDQHVLTAAHCINTGVVTKREIEKYIIMLGKYEIQKYNEAGSIITDAKNIVVHSDYVYPNPDADLAIITLAHVVKYNAFVRPICLFNPSLDDTLIGKKGKVVGWGRDEQGNKLTQELRETNIVPVSQEECLRSNPVFASLTSERTFCADGEKEGSTPCNGDSGGGVFMQVDRRWYLRGLISSSLAVNSSYPYCDPTKYTIFVDVLKFHSWINDKINYF